MVRATCNSQRETLREKTCNYIYLDAGSFLTGGGGRGSSKAEPTSVLNILQARYRTSQPLPLNALRAEKCLCVHRHHTSPSP